MFYTYDQLKDHNTSFYDAFVDLKVEGWKSYAKALNSYTLGFYKVQIEKSTEMVEKLGSNMKKLAKETV
jgi:hypothetical protein